MITLLRHDRRAAVVAIVLGSCAPDAMDNMNTHTSTALGVRFAYPDSLLVGRFGNIALPPEAIVEGLEEPFANAVVLIRPADLGTHPLDSIPVGDVPTIWIDRSFAATAAARLLQPDTSYAVGDVLITKFPGFPGPYGDEAFFYVARFPDGVVVEVSGHRRDMRTEGTTGFDVIIEQILASMERVEP